MSTCAVFNCRHSPYISRFAQGGERIVYIGRGRKGQAHMLNTAPGRTGWLGNPYRIGPREHCIARFRMAFAYKLRTDELFRAAVKKRLPGSSLVCYCKPLPCHGDVIAEYVNAGFPDDWEPHLPREFPEADPSPAPTPPPT